jgi:hypothetical protein
MNVIHYLTICHFIINFDKKLRWQSQGPNNIRREKMKKLLDLVLIVLLLTSALAVGAEETSGQSEKKTEKIGIYDSRAIVVAFVGSQVYKDSDGKKMLEMQAEYNKAKSAGDLKGAAELEAWGKAQQVLLHKQGFSTTPVDDILVHIKDQIPEIAKAAGVDLIISKWDKETLAKHKSAELVDITIALVKAFHPTERQMKASIEIQKHDPIPLSQAENIND